MIILLKELLLNDFKIFANDDVSILFLSLNATNNIFKMNYLNLVKRILKMIQNILKSEEYDKYNRVKIIKFLTDHAELDSTINERDILSRLNKQNKNSKH